MHQAMHALSLIRVRIIQCLELSEVPNNKDWLLHDWDVSDTMRHIMQSVIMECGRAGSETKRSLNALTPNGHREGILQAVVQGTPPALMLLPAMTRPSSLVLDIAGVSTATHNPLPALPWVGVKSNNEGRDPGLSFQH